MNEEEFTEECFLCGKIFPFSHGRYYGHYNKYYKFMTCENCHTGNWDGWNPMHEEKIINHSEENGIAIPDANDKGFLPRRE